MGLLDRPKSINIIFDSKRFRRELKVVKQEIVNAVADNLDITKVKAEMAVDAFFLSMKEALQEGERIELRGFGVFVVKPRKSGIGRNPRTGAEVPITPGKTVRFKPGKDIR